VTENPNHNDRLNTPQAGHQSGDVAPFCRRDAITEYDVDGDGRPRPDHPRRPAGLRMVSVYPAAGCWCGHPLAPSGR
jgi:hypothetical protein